jgi:protein-tyrosine-phosphatase
MTRLPQTVLFACNHNHVRSPMAAALMRQMFGREVFVESCGMSPQSQDSECDPLAAAVMGEVGLDIADHAPKTFNDLEDEGFDLVVSLTPEAYDRAQALARGRAVEVEYWPMPDPTQGELRSREAALAAYRQLRDDLRNRLAARFGAAQPAST